MTHDWDIDIPMRLIVERWTGEVTLEALVHGLSRIEADPEFDPEFDMIGDFSEAHFRLTIQELDTFRSHVAVRNWAKSGRRVVIAPGDLEFGVSRQAQIHWDIDGQMVFRTEAEARAWLGAPLLHDQNRDPSQE